MKHNLPTELPPITTVLSDADFTLYQHIALAEENSRDNTKHFAEVEAWYDGRVCHLKALIEYNEEWRGKKFNTPSESCPGNAACTGRGEEENSDKLLFVGIQNGYLVERVGGTMGDVNGERSFVPDLKALTAVASDSVHAFARGNDEFTVELVFSTPEIPPAKHPEEEEEEE